MIKFVVIWTTNEFRPHFWEPCTDHWETFEEWSDAKAKYDQLTEDESVMTASITVPVLSTDY